MSNSETGVQETPLWAQAPTILTILDSSEHEGLIIDQQ